jgi:hypothetical protein
MYIRVSRLRHPSSAACCRPRAKETNCSRVFGSSVLLQRTWRLCQLQGWIGRAGRQSFGRRQKARRRFVRSAKVMTWRLVLSDQKSRSMIAAAWARLGAENLRSPLSPNRIVAQLQTTNCMRPCGVSRHSYTRGPMATHDGRETGSLLAEPALGRALALRASTLCHWLTRMTMVT